MARVRGDYAFGTIDVAVDASATTISSPDLDRLPAVASPDIAVVVLHDTAAGTYEILHVTDHTAAATTATVVRGTEGSTAQSWATGTTWQHGPTASDFDNYVEADGVPRLSGGTSEPADPVEGQMFYDHDAILPPTPAADISADDTNFANIAGTTVQAALDSIDDLIVGVGSGTLTVQDENVSVEAGVTVMDFRGTGVTVTDGAAGEVLVTIGPTVKYKTADESVANNTLQDDNHLFFAIGANETWVVQWHLYASCASASVDIKMAPSAPSGATMRYGLHGGASTLTSTEGDMHVQSHSTGPANPIQAGVPASSGSDSYVLFTATIENGATAGTVNLQWAQQTTDAVNVMNVKRGSSMIANRAA